MMKKTGLGKGLNALFSDNNVYSKKEDDNSERVVQLKLTEVEPNRDQPRKIFDEDALNELAESIKKHGVIQPIIVTKKEEYYQIVAGERRWRASKIAGMTEVPAILREDNDKLNKEIALIENIQREDLNALEKAFAIKTLMDEYNLTQQEVADMLGKSRSGIANTIRLLNLDVRIKTFVLEGKLTEGHCKALLAISDHEKQYEAAIRIIEDGDTVRDVEEKIQVKKNIKSQSDPRNEVILRDIEDSFQSFFGTKVKLSSGKKKGKIVIEYKNNEDLERIIGLIK